MTGMPSGARVRALVIFLSIPALSLAQEDAELLCAATSVASDPPMILDPAISVRFQEVSACLSAEDVECAETAMDGLDPRDLDGNERTVALTMEGDIEAVDGSQRRARRAYENAVEAATHPAMKRQALARLAMLHLREDDPRDARRALEEIDCAVVTPDLLYLRSVAYYGLGEYQASIDTVETAIAAQRQIDDTIPPTWAAHNQRSLTAREEELRGDSGIQCTEETSVGSYIPSRTCTTAEERRRMEQANRAQAEFEILRGLGEL